LTARVRLLKVACVIFWTRPSWAIGRAMRFPRIRFTIGQLIGLVAALAVLFAVLRTPFWPLIPTVAMVLFGFRRDRARGGDGLGGAIIAGIIALPGFFVVVDFHEIKNELLGYGEIGPVGVGLSILMVGVLGVIFGLFVGSVAYWVHYVLDELEAYKRTGPDARPDDRIVSSREGDHSPSRLVSRPGQEAVGSIQDTRETASRRDE
jgi:hypothetical protein